MEYIKLINRFWETNRNTQFTMAETTLYFYLLNEANRNYWQMPIVCATAIICASTGMTKAMRIPGVLSFPTWPLVLIRRSRCVRC